MTEMERESQKRFLKHIDECGYCNKFIKVAWHNGKPKKYLEGMEWRECPVVEALVKEFDVPPDVSEATW